LVSPPSVTAVAAVRLVLPICTVPVLASVPDIVRSLPPSLGATGLLSTSSVPLLVEASCDGERRDIVNPERGRAAVGEAVAQGERRRVGWLEITGIAGAPGSTAAEGQRCGVARRAVKM
jgi:hypothetical protein